MSSSIKKNRKVALAREKPIVNVRCLVRDVCSVYIEKGRFHSTASKLSMTKGKCTRITRELEILQSRFKLR